MRKLKWWQWTLIGLFAIGIFNAVFTPPRRNTPQAPSNPPAPPTADAKFAVIGTDIFSMAFNATADPETLPDIARQQCGARHFCMITGWTDAKYVARAFPLTNREVEHQAFAYRLNRNTGLEKSLWDCSRWKRAYRNECL